MRELRNALLASLACLIALPALARAADPPYGIESFSATESSSQAGAHPDFTLSFSMNHKEGTQEAVAATRDMEFELPPGLLGNPNATPKCTEAVLVATDIYDSSNDSSCPQDSQVGVAEVEVTETGGVTANFLEPIYNMQPSGPNVLARFGLIAQVYPTFINVEIRSEGDYGVTASLEGISSLVPLLSAESTFWGVPADESHDTQRITPYEAVYNSGVPDTPDGKRSNGLRPEPLMVNPTSCGGPLPVRMTARSYLDPGSPVSAEDELPAIAGCEKLAFDPYFSFKPTSREAAAPSGAEANLSIPQDETAAGLASAQIKDAVVTLPEGMTIAPGAADGLAACSASDAGYGTRGPAHCPQASQIGTVDVDVPVLERALHGQIYQRTPAPGNLFRIWLIADDYGLHLKLPGTIHLDPQSGQLTSVFLDLPPAPVAEVALHFKGGSRAPLATPDRCGTYVTSFSFTPHSGGRAVSGVAPMRIDRGCDTGGFDPQVSAGATNPQAGAYSPFDFELTLEAGEENLAGLDVALPTGLAARFAGVALCPPALAPTGACPAASKVGSVAVASGPGSTPLWIPQPGKDPTAVYLAGPYKGAPYSFVISVPAQAGPFDLGDVVTRAALHVDPRSAQGSVSTDPLPQIIEGVPVSYRDVRVAIDRPDFTLNPTGCEEKQVAATATSEVGTVATPAERFQLAGCRGLGFKPRLTLRLKGGVGRGAHPSLRSVFRPRRGDANLRRLVLRLPHSAFLDQAHIRTICTRVQFAANGGNGGGCPKGAIYGHAKAWTPLLAEPLTGPVYLRSSKHNLPDFVAALHGRIDVEAVARIDSKQGGIRTTFTTVPDAPLSRVVVNMQGGKKGLIVNSKNLCHRPGRNRAGAGYLAHNGRRANGRPPVRAAGCQKKHGKRKGHKRPAR